MNERPGSYDLLDEKWIPVLRTNGKVDRVGIRGALVEAASIRQLAASNPMDRVAILRFLLAVLYWCQGSPPDGMNAASDDPFPADWFSKLDVHKDCFSLLGQGKRFYQCAEAPPPGAEKLSASYLIQEIPTGTNLNHFRHSMDSVDGLCQACCAMGLLRLPLFATSGGRGKPPAINAKPPLYVMPVGTSLAATLRLSWRQALNLGMPQWESPGIQLPESGEVPLLTGLTWVPRRVWLDNPETPEGNCVSCASRERLIRRCVFAGIGSTKTGDDRPRRVWRDPHVIHEQGREGDVTALHARSVLGTPDAAAGQWASAVAGIVREWEALYGWNRAWIVGFATVQNDKYLEAMEYVVDPGAPDEAQDALGRLERWRKEGGGEGEGKDRGLVRQVPQPQGMSSSTRKHVEIRSAIAAIRPHVEARVSARADELLTGGDAAWQEASREYRPMMEVIAKSFSPGFTVSAVRRRRQVERVAPDMWPMTEAAKKPGRMKGGPK